MRPSSPAPGLAGAGWADASTSRRPSERRAVSVRRVPVPPEVITLAVRWYLRYGLSYWDVEELLAERGVDVDHVTVYRWVPRFTPLFAEAARPGRHAVGDRWFVDETYVKVAGRWRYLYRAVDQFGPVIVVLLSKQRDTAAARRFFERALGHEHSPVEVTNRQGRAYLRVLGDLIPAAAHVTEQYANNRVEADHGRLKARLRPMRGLKRFHSAEAIASGPAFLQNLRRGHYELATDAPAHQPQAKAPVAPPSWSAARAPRGSAGRRRSGTPPAGRRRSRTPFRAAAGIERASEDDATPAASSPAASPSTAGELGPPKSPRRPDTADPSAPGVATRYGGVPRETAKATRKSVRGLAQPFGVSCGSITEFVEHPTDLNNGGRRRDITPTRIAAREAAGGKGDIKRRQTPTNPEDQPTKEGAGRCEGLDS